MPRIIIIFTVILFSCATENNLFAATAETSMTSAGLRMFWGLLVVLGVLLLLYGLARKRLSPVYTNAKSKIKVLEIRHLMPKKSLCLVEVSGRKYLLGLGADTITLISIPEENQRTNFSSTLESMTEENEQATP